MSKKSKIRTHTIYGIEYFSKEVGFAELYSDGSMSYTDRKGRIHTSWVRPNGEALKEALIAFHLFDAIMVSADSETVEVRERIMNELNSKIEQLKKIS